jgi:hypothetical protein
VRDRWPATKQQLQALTNDLTLREELLNGPNGPSEIVESGSYETEEFHRAPTQPPFVLSTSSSVSPEFHPNSYSDGHAQNRGAEYRQYKVLRATGKAALFGGKALLKTAGFLLETINPLPVLLGEGGSGGKLQRGATVVAARSVVRDHGWISSRKVPEGTLGFISGVSYDLLGTTYSVTWQLGFTTSQVRANEINVIAPAQVRGALSFA